MCRGEQQIWYGQNVQQIGGLFTSAETTSCSCVTAAARLGGTAAAHETYLIWVSILAVYQTELLGLVEQMVTPTGTKSYIPVTDGIGRNQIFCSQIWLISDLWLYEYWENGQVWILCFLRHCIYHSCHHSMSAPRSPAKNKHGGQL